MDPNQNQNQMPPYPPQPPSPSGQSQQPQYSIDYLNQIAPPPQKQGISNKFFLILVGGGLLLALVVGAMVLFSGGGGGPKEKMQTLAARLQTLQKISDESQKNIKSGTLRSINSNLTIFLANANRDIAEPFMSSGIDVTKLDETIMAAENGEKLSQKLEDARLNAVFDRTYAREMAYQLDTVAGLMTEIYNKTNKKALKDFLVNTDNNLQPIKRQLYDFNAANS